MWTKSRVFAWSVFSVCLVTMASGPRVVTQSSGPVAAYALSDGSGTTAADSSGNALTADLLNGATWTLPPHVLTTLTLVP